MHVTREEGAWGGGKGGGVPKSVWGLSANLNQMLTCACTKQDSSGLSCERLLGS